MNPIDESFLVRHRTWFLLAVAVFLYVSFLGVRDFWYPDEPDIGEVAQAMYLSGDWIAPRRNGVIWVDYWPMLYWVGCACCTVLGGVSEFALRLASALGAIALVLWTCRVASRVFGARAGLWAGFMLLTGSSFLYGAVSYRPDMLFSLAIGGAFFAYAKGADEEGRWWPRILAFALLGAAVLTKGPLGLLLPGLVLTLWHASRREWKRLLQLAPLTLVALAVAAPWAFACADAMGSDRFWSEIYQQNFGRYEAGNRGHGKPLHYYAVVVWLDLGPWVFLLPFALRWLVHTGRWRDRNVQLYLWWFGTFFVFLSLAATKRQCYLMPAYAAAMLLLAPWVADLFRPDAEGETPSARVGRLYVRVYSGWLALFGTVTFAAAAAMPLILPRLDVDGSAADAVRLGRVPALALGVLCVGLGAWVWRAERRDAPREALLRSGATLVPFYAVLMAWVIPSFNGHKTYAPQCEWIVEQIPAEETHIGLYFPLRNIAKMGAFGFYTERIVALCWNVQNLETFFEEHPQSVALVQDEIAEELFAAPGRDWRAWVIEDFEAGRYHYFVLKRS